MWQIKCKYLDTSPNDFCYFSNHFKFCFVTSHKNFARRMKRQIFMVSKKNQFSLLHNVHVNHYSFSSQIKRSILCAIYMHSLSYVILLIIGVPFESTLLAIKYYFHTSSILMYYLTF